MSPRQQLRGGMFQKVHESQCACPPGTLARLVSPEYSLFQVKGRERERDAIFRTERRWTVISPALKRLAKSAARRLRLVKSTYVRFRGAYPTYQEAIASVRKGALAGYDNDEVVDVGFGVMCQLEIWDYPVLYWLRRLNPETRCIVDAGGHMGTKYRAFRKHLESDDAPGIGWSTTCRASFARAGSARARTA